MLIAVGCDTIATATLVQPFASVVVTEYDCAHNAVAVVVVCDVTSFHKYVYGPVPPPASTVAEPSQDRLQVVLIEETIPVINAVGSEILTGIEAVHPAPSVTMNE